MAHLKKFSERLAKPFIPSIKNIITIGSEGEEALQAPATRIGSISRKFKELYIPSLTMTASHHKLASLSAPQIGIPFSTFVIHKDLVAQKWAGYNSSPSDYKVYINPMIKNLGNEMDSQIEECPSLPGILAEVNRYTKIEVQHTDFEGEEVREQFEGFEARVFQNSLDHLWGFLLINFSVSNGRISLKNPRPNSEFQKTLEEFKTRIEAAKSKLEDRYLCDSDFKSKVDQSEQKEDYFEREILDSEFEIEFMCAINEAIEADLEAEEEELELSEANLNK